MTVAFRTPPREFVPGTTGWTADDLNDAAIERLWEGGSYEIVEGVLTTMPPAYYEGGSALDRLADAVKEWMKQRGIDGRFGWEVDFVVDNVRVAKADALLMMPEDLKRQKRENRRSRFGRPKLRFGRVLVPPTLIIESVSPGHEHHDRATKHNWYAEAGVPNYWLLDAYRKSLDCLVLEAGAYREDVTGRRNAIVRPGAFPGLEVRLKELWI